MVDPLQNVQCPQIEKTKCWKKSQREQANKISCLVRALWIYKTNKKNIATSTDRDRQRKEAERERERERERQTDRQTDRQ